MGLDTTHDCWTGSYSAFHIWRNKLAEVAGYKFEKSEDGIYDVILERELVEESFKENLKGKWKKTPQDPLIVLLYHYDTEGDIYRDQQIPLANRLTELLPLLPNEEADVHIGNWHEKTQKFINGLLLAYEANETIEFL